MIYSLWPLNQDRPTWSTPWEGEWLKCWNKWVQWTDSISTSHSSHKMNCNAVKVLWVSFREVWLLICEALHCQFPGSQISAWVATFWGKYFNRVWPALNRKLTRIFHNHHSMELSRKPSPSVQDVFEQPLRGKQMKSVQFLWEVEESSQGLDSSLTFLCP